jgi:hypothetical protein
LKVYQVRYTEYGIVNWCYTINFIDCFLTRSDAIENKNKIILGQDFYDKLILYKK